jgi:hypothetical protein
MFKTNICVKASLMMEIICSISLCLIISGPRASICRSHLVHRYKQKQSVMGAIESIKKNPAGAEVDDRG